MSIKIPGLERYYGGKNGPGVYQAIINEIPPHTTYIEPFLGSGAIMRNKKLAQFNIGIEIDKRVIDLWRKANPKHIELIQGNSLKLLPELARECSFTYCDTPYPLLARQTKTKSYRHEMSNLQHIEFLELVKDLAGNVCVSSYPNPMYNEYLKGWRTLEFETQTRKGTATEILYMNYPCPDSLHDYSYWGKDKRHRQDFRKKITGYQQKLMKLSVIERNGIISALSDL